MGYNINAGNKVFAAELEQVYRGSGSYAADAGSTDAYAITAVPAPASLSAGMAFKFKANTANTGPATLNVNSLGAITIKKNYNQDLVTGDIVANQIVTVVYDGTNFQLLSPTSAVAATAKLSIVTTDVVINASAAETTLLTASIPADLLGTNNGVRVRMYIDANGGANSGQSLTFKLKYGSTTIATAASATGGGQTFKGYIEFLLLANAATNAQEGSISMQGNNNGVPQFIAAVGTAAENSTTALNLVITSQWGTTTGLGSPSLTMSHAVVEKIS